MDGQPYGPGYQPPEDQSRPGPEVAPPPTPATVWGDPAGPAPSGEQASIPWQPAAPAATPAPADAGWGQQLPPPSGWGPPAPAAGGWGPPVAADGPAGWSPAGYPPPAPDARAGLPGPSWNAYRPKPGIIPLRPLRLGEIYDGAVQSLRSNPRTMLGFSALVIGLITLVTTVIQSFAMVEYFGDLLAMDEDTADPEQVLGAMGGMFGAILLPAVLQGLTVTVLSGLLMVAVSEAVLGRRIGPGQLWVRVRRRVPALIGLTLLQGLVSGLVILVALLPGILVVAAGSDVGGAVLMGFGVLGGIVLLFALWYSRWAMAAPVLLLEEQGVVQALRRSWMITRGSAWRVFGILILTLILTSLLLQVVSVPFQMIGMVAGALLVQDMGESAVLVVSLASTALGTVIAGTVLYPFQAAVTALLFVDLRMRREGLDLQLIQALEEDRTA